MSEDTKFILQNIAVLALLWLIAVGGIYILDEECKRPLPPGDQLYEEAHRRDFREQVEFEKRAKCQEAVRREWEERR